MRTSNIPARNGFISVMRFFAVLYAVGGILFFIFHGLMASLLGMEGAPNRFWVALAVSMMAMLSFLSWQSSRRPEERAFVSAHLLSKVVSVTGFLLAFGLEQRLPAYLVGAITDGMVIVVVLFFFKRMAGVTPRVRTGQGKA